MLFAYNSLKFLKHFSNDYIKSAFYSRIFLSHSSYCKFITCFAKNCIKKIVDTDDIDRLKRHLLIFWKLNTLLILI